MNVLIVGGSGFVSGTLARRAVEAGHQVWAVTRGEREIPEGVRPIRADRKDAGAFAEAIGAVDVDFDLVADCICYATEDMDQDLAQFLSAGSKEIGHFVLISTDFVYEPSKRRYPQSEDDADYIDAGYGYNKRQCELMLKDRAAHDRWTVLRPCHIYGPGSKLGCLPEHSRDEGLIATLKSKSPLSLVGGGSFLQQPVFVRDLADAILAAPGAPASRGAICNISGPEIIESKRYYEILGEYLGVPVTIEEIPVTTYLSEHQDKRSFLCHRIYTLEALKAAGLPAPGTGAEAALEAHLNSLL